MAQSKTTSATQKRFLAVLMALVLACMCMLVGCSSDNAASNNASSQSASSQQSSSASSDDTVAPTELNVTVSADATAVEGGEVTETTVTVPVGATVFDALEASGMEIVASDSTYGKFIESINGVTNGDAGSQSGWIYQVNGEDIMESADSAEVNDGDTVTFTFIV